MRAGRVGTRMVKQAPHIEQTEQAKASASLLENDAVNSPSGDYAQASQNAREYHRVADEHVDALKGFWKRFLTSGLFVLAAIVIIFAALAWFAANNHVGAATSGVSAQSNQRIAISGVSAKDAKAGCYERDTTPDENKTSLDVSDAMDVGTVQYENGKASVTFDLNNSGETGGALVPGSSGQLQITVTPLANDVGDVTVSIDWNIATTKGAIVDGQTADAELSSLRELVRGHIMLFQGRDNGYYSSPVLVADGSNGAQSFTIEHSQFCEAGSELTTKPVSVVLYWVWPEQFQSFVLTGDTNYRQNLFASTNAPGYADTLASINRNPARFFRAESGESVQGVPTCENGMLSANLQICSNYYNNADEIIGSNVAFVQPRFSLSESEVAR